MLDNIDKNQRYKLKLDSLSLPSPDRHRTLRHQMSTDNMNVPPFNIPNLRVEQRKTSSAEDMARKNSISGPSGTGSVGGGFKSMYFTISLLLWQFLYFVKLVNPISSLSSILHILINNTNVSIRYWHRAVVLWLEQLYKS